MNLESANIDENFADNAAWIHGLLPRDGCVAPDASNEPGRTA